MISFGAVTGIRDQEALIEAVRYIASETTRMTEKVLGATFPISSLTVFAHSPEEFDVLAYVVSR